MAFTTGLSTFMLVLMLASLPFSQSSRTPQLGLEAGTAMAKQKEVTQGVEMKKVEMFESNGDWVIQRNEDEESARQVPTGPDPLHHNENPITP